MWSPAWNKGPRGGAAPAARHAAAVALAGLVLAAPAGCSSQPARTAPPAPPPLELAENHDTAPPTSGPGSAASAAVGATAPAAAARPQVPPAARADFERAVNYLRAGNTLEAELGFKQVALQYPQFAGPLEPRRSAAQ